jgi:hypothetical protein
MGGGQGNPLTGLFYAILQDRALRGVEERNAGVTIKAIHDDVTLAGPPNLIFGSDGAPGALEDFLSSLRADGIKPNLHKFKALGSKPSSCEKKPAWLEEPTCFRDSNKQVLVNARGIALCNSPIGERAFEEAYLEQKSNGICSAIKRSNDALVPLNCQSANLAFTYSY